MSQYTRRSEEYEADDSRNVINRPASSKMEFQRSATEVNRHLINSFVEDPEEELDEQNQEYSSLPYLQGILFATLLEDCITQLRILGECNNELRIIKTVADMSNLRAKKYQIKHESEQAIADISHKNLGSMRYKLDKLVADRNYCTEVLMGTYLELSLNRCFSTLSENNQNIIKTYTYRIELAEEEARNKLLRRDVLRQLRQQRNHIKSVAYDTNLIVEQLRSKVEDAALNTETRSRYINNWQRARSEQHAQIIQDKEAGPSDAIKYYRQRADHEHRVHSEVELLVDIFINDILAKVEMWMTKYDEDMEEVDLKIQIQKNRYQDETERRIEMEKTIVEHEMLMNNWIDFKNKREAARQYREKMVKSAIIVQAWWRGLLVRLELGPFKPKKRPPVGKKKK